jgi:hypothetical protein
MDPTSKPKKDHPVSVINPQKMSQGQNPNTSRQKVFLKPMPPTYAKPRWMLFKLQIYTVNQVSRINPQE